MKLATWMHREGLDDEGLGEKVEADRTTISRIRRGKSRPSWELAKRLREISVGKVTPNDFLENAA